MIENTGTYSRCTGVLIWYDEPLELLAAHVASLTGCIDHLVAVDGAYALFPDAKPSSAPDQARLIAEICSGARIGLTLCTPASVWRGNEVQKRNHSIVLAEAVTDPEIGWYLVLDADYVITEVAEDWFVQLERIAKEGWGAIDIGIREVRKIPGYEVDPADGYQPIRDVYRAARNMSYGPQHWIMHAPDPETGEYTCFRGPNEFEPVDSYDGTYLMKFDHRTERPAYRVLNSNKYYLKRDKLGIETGARVFTRKLSGEFGELQQT